MIWKANPEVINLMKAQSNKPEYLKLRVRVENKELTWPEIIDEVRKGTEFGKIFHKNTLSAILSNEIVQTTTKVAG
jgi:hypothetical protein